MRSEKRPHIWRDFFAALWELVRMTPEERQKFWIDESKD